MLNSVWLLESSCHGEERSPVLRLQNIPPAPAAELTSDKHRANSTIEATPPLAKAPVRLRLAQALGQAILADSMALRATQGMKTRTGDYQSDYQSAAGCHPARIRSSQYEVSTIAAKIAAPQHGSADKMSTNKLMALTIKPKENCRYDLVALGEIMLRFDPGDRRVRYRALL